MNYLSNSNAKENVILQWLPVAFLALIVGVLPFIVFMRIVEFNSLFQELYSKTAKVNFFSYYRSVWLLILVGSGMLFFVVNRRSAPCWYHWPIVIYSFLVVLSTIFSQYPELAVWGSPNRHEGMWVHLSYMAIVFLFIQFIKSARALKVIVAAICVSGALLALLGTLQFFNLNYMLSEIPRTYLVPYVHQEVAQKIQWLSSVSADLPAFITFGNSNFAGSYLAMLFPFTLALILGFSGRLRFVLIPVNILAYISLLACKSRAGFYASLAGVLMLLFFYRRQIIKQWRIIGVLMIVYTITPILMDAYTIKSQSRFLDTAFTRGAMTKKSIFGNFEDLKLGKDFAEAVFDGVQIKIKVNTDRSVEFYDSSDDSISYKLLAVVKDNGSPSEASGAIESNLKFEVATQTDGDFSYIAGQLAQNKSIASDGIPVLYRPEQFKLKKEPGKKFMVLFPEKKLRGFIVFVWPEQQIFEISRAGGSLFLVKTKNGFKMLNHLFKAAEIKEVETLGFKNMEQFASRRGYIWARTLPLLKRAMFIGYGPDTFPAHFPNYDLIGKLKHWGTINLMIEKPHNFYLQVFFNSGLISLLALLVLFAGYFIESLRHYVIRTELSFENAVGIGLCVAVFGYLCAAFFNDSVVAVAPVFWSFLGLGIAVNRLGKSPIAE
jgi:hypothetical protein